MHRVIYVDTLIFLNTVITFIILLSVRQLYAVKSSEGRLFTASFLGGFFSLIIFAPKIGFVSTVLLKILICCIIVLTAFSINDAKKFFRCFGLFILITFLYGGAMYFASGLVNNEFILYKNGYGYVGLSFGALLVLSVVLYFIIKFLKKRFFNREESFNYEIEITYNGKKVQGAAFFDSGNFMSDVYTGNPVIIADREFILPLLDVVESEELTVMSGCLSPLTSNKLKLRLIPVKTVSGSHMLPAFTCDSAVIKNDDSHYTVTSPSLAVVNGGFGPARCEAIINKNVFL